MKRFRGTYAYRKLKHKLSVAAVEVTENRYRSSLLSIAERFNIRGADMAFSEKLLNRQQDQDRSNKPTINWFIPAFAHPYGGIYTIFRIADQLAERGFLNRMIVYDEPDFSLGKSRTLLQRSFPHVDLDEVFGLKGSLDELPASDYAVATFWTTCYLLLKFKKTKRKLYLVQDYEAAFYPVNTNYAMVENTYRMPFHRIFNTIGLKQYIEGNYPVPLSRGMSFTPCVEEVYRPRFKTLDGTIRILFYGRPSTPRNGFELGLQLMKKLKEHYGDRVEIVSAGEEYDLKKLGFGHFSKYFKNAGIVPYEKLPEFYSSFHFTIALMYTKHPSYLPLEAMASGSCVIANYNEANTWLLRHLENSIFMLPAIDLLMEAFDKVVSNEQLYRNILQEAYKTVHKTDWKSEMKKVTDFVENL